MMRGMLILILCFVTSLFVVTSMASAAVIVNQVTPEVAVIITDVPTVAEASEANRHEATTARRSDGRLVVRVLTTPVRIVAKIREARPVRTVIAKVIEARPVRSVVARVVRAQPVHRVVIRIVDRPRLLHRH